MDLANPFEVLIQRVESRVSSLEEKLAEILTASRRLERSQELLMDLAVAVYAKSEQTTATEE